MTKYFLLLPNDHIEKEKEKENAVWCADLLLVRVGVPIIVVARVYFKLCFYMDNSLFLDAFITWLSPAKSLSYLINIWVGLCPIFFFSQPCAPISQNPSSRPQACEVIWTQLVHFTPKRLESFFLKAFNKALPLPVRVSIFLLLNWL